MTKRALILVAAFALHAWIAPAMPNQINFQAVVNDASGQPIDGSLDVVLRLYDAPTGGSLLWEETHSTFVPPQLSVTDGLFDVGLGDPAHRTGGSEPDLASLVRAHADVWLAIQIAPDPDEMTPRIEVSPAAWSLEADTVDGLESTDFLRSNSSDTFSSGFLTFAAGTTLAVDGGLEVAGKVVTADGAELSKLDGTSADVTAANLNLLTGGGDASALHTHSGVDADTLDSLDSSQFLRRDVDTTFDGSSGATLTVQQPASTSKTEALVLRNNSTQAGSNAGLRFQMSSSAAAYQAAIRAERQSSGGGDLVFETATTYDGPPVERLRITEDGQAEVAGDLTVGLASAGPPQIQLGSGANTLGFDGTYFTFSDGIDVLGNSDFADDVSIGARSAIDDDYLYFDAGNESLTWDDPSRFVLSDDLVVSGTLSLGQTLSDDDYLYFDGGNEHLVWREAVLFDEGYFEFSDDIEFLGELTSTERLRVRAPGNVETVIDIDNTSTFHEARWWVDSHVTGTQLAEIQEDGDFRIAGTLSQNVAFDVAETFWAGERIAPGELVRIDPDRSDTVLRTTGALDRGVLGVVSSHPGVLLGDAPFDRETLRRVWGDDRLAAFDAERPDLAATVLASRSDLHAWAAQLASDEGAVASAKALGVDSAEHARRALESEIDGDALELFFAERVVPVALAGRVPVRVDAGYGAIRPGDLLAPSPRPGVAMRSDGRGTVVATALEALDEGEGLVLAFVRLQSPAGDLDETVLADFDRRLQGVERSLAEPGLASPAVDPVPVASGDGPADRGPITTDERGDLRVPGAVVPGAVDIAEMFPVAEPVQPGEVLVVDRDRPGVLRRSSWDQDPAVVGIAAAAPGVLVGAGEERMAGSAPQLAARLEQAREAGDHDLEQRLRAQLEARFLTGHVPLAVSGSVLCRVDAADGAIAPGDLLVSSNTPGHARRADDPAPGTVIGKALEALDYGTGAIRVLVMLR